MVGDIIAVCDEILEQIAAAHRFNADGSQLYLLMESKGATRASHSLCSFNMDDIEQSECMAILYAIMLEFTGTWAMCQAKDKSATALCNRDSPDESCQIQTFVGDQFTFCHAFAVGFPLADSIRVECQEHVRQCPV